MIFDILILNSLFMICTNYSIISPTIASLIFLMTERAVRMNDQLHTKITTTSNIIAAVWNSPKTGILLKKNSWVQYGSDQHCGKHADYCRKIPYAKACVSQKTLTVHDNICGYKINNLLVQVLQMKLNNYRRYLHKNRHVPDIGIRQNWDIRHPAEFNPTFTR